MNVTDLKTLKCTITSDVRATQLESDKVNDYFAKRISFQNMTAAFFVSPIVPHNHRAHKEQNMRLVIRVAHDDAREIHRLFKRNMEPTKNVCHSPDISP